MWLTPAPVKSSYGPAAPGLSRMLFSENQNEKRWNFLKKRERKKYEILPGIYVYKNHNKGTSLNFTNQSTGIIADKVEEKK